MENHITGEMIDEFDFFFDKIIKVLSKTSNIKSTWFIRIDNDIERRFGTATYLLDHHSDKIKWLNDNGHEIGWHFHSYKNVNGQLLFQDDNDKIVKEMILNGSKAIDCNMRVSRMGFSYHNNETMAVVENLGFKVDSTAIPRPIYSWNKSSANWSTSSCKPYFPSISDYRIPGSENRNLLQVPISTVPLSLPSDTVSNVKRYVSASYKEKIFRKIIESNGNCNPLVMCSHPYELFKCNELNKYALSFDINQFSNNLSFLIRNGYTFQTLINIYENNKRRA